MLALRTGEDSHRRLIFSGALRSGDTRGESHCVRPVPQTETSSSVDQKWLNNPIKMIIGMGTPSRSNRMERIFFSFR